MFATVLVETMPAAIVNVASDAPAGMVTLAGTCAFVLSLARLIVTPAAGATALIATSPVILTPPTVDVGDRLTDDTPNGSIVSGCVIVTPPDAALILDVRLETGTVV